MPTSEAPGELELVRLFVNSVHYPAAANEEFLEELATPAELQSWLAAHDLGGREQPSERDRERAIELREAIRALLFANNGEPLDPDAVPTLNRFGDDLGLHLRFDKRGDSELAPAAGGTDGALSRLLAIVFRSMADGTWSRLKACRDDACKWAFYDRSRNRSGTWCSMDVCGNRAKARAYRHRHAGK
jgi:predicted RNA-binding Zn ribbon-like protein